MPDGNIFLFGNGSQSVALHIYDESVFSTVMARGDIGFAEGYLNGSWDCSDLRALLSLLVSNREHLKRAVYGSWKSLLAARLRHLANRNSRHGSKKNIMAHYDLGNDFYRLWLDESMSYSAAIFKPGQSLKEAQWSKYQRILDKLDAKAGCRVLEVDCGWGGFALQAINQGLDVTGVTLSPAQLQWARQTAPDADLRLQDYRDIDEQFDYLVSIEMFEAVGERWWPSYFKMLSRALKDSGKAVVQTITIHEDLFKSYRRSTDFIQQYIFPGGMLPSRPAFRKAAARYGLRVVDEYAFGKDYAKTLAAWRDRFEQNWSSIESLGFDSEFRKLWNFYLAYCQTAFEQKNIDVVQFELRHA